MYCDKEIEKPEVKNAENCKQNWISRCCIIFCLNYKLNEVLKLNKSTNK